MNGGGGGVTANKTKRPDEAAKLDDEIENYTAELNDLDEAANGSGGNDVSELLKFSNVNHRLYQNKGYRWMNLPEDKYQVYNDLTRRFGYEYESKNQFLCNNGIIDILHLQRPFFCYWENGLDLYLPSAHANQHNDKTVNFMFKRSICRTHDLKCDRNCEEKCNIEYACESGATMKYMVSGIFRVFNKISFTSYSIELDETIRVETPHMNVANTLSINNKNVKIHLLTRCRHDGSCGIGDDFQPFAHMTPVKKLCNKIESPSKFSEDYNYKRCVAYGKGIVGKLYSQTNTVYPTTYNLTDLFIEE